MKRSRSRLLAALLLAGACPAWGGPAGMGFFVTADGYFVTSYRLLADAGPLLVRDADGGTHSAQVVGTDPANDLALLKTEGVFPAIPIVASAALRAGDPVFALSPGSAEPGSVVGLVAGTAVTPSDDAGDRKILPVSISVGLAASGGPLLTAEGNAIALMVPARDGTAAVRSEHLLALIKAEQPAWAQLPAPGDPQEQAPERALVTLLSGQPDPQSPAQPDQGELAVAEMYRIGNRARLERDFEPARRWLLAAAVRGHAPAQTALADLYSQGQGGAPDEAEALKWYRAAALQGEPEAQARLGALYTAGKGVARDDDQAVAWVRRAAEAGNASGQNALGVMYRDGRGVYRDDAKAAQWFRRAALQGNPDAQANLGLMFRDGRELEQDPAEAAWWLRRAADQGHAAARDYLQEIEKTRPRRDP